MKSLFVLGYLFVSAIDVFAQTSSEVLQDTVRNDTIRMAPYFDKTPSRALGNFSWIGNDKMAFQTYAGFSVLNTLRGNMPNLSVDPNTSPQSAGIRNSESMLIIDGLPFNSRFNNYYNLNSFEYQRIYTQSSGNSAAIYGTPGVNGAIFLQSKTGENFRLPSFEFNSSTSLLTSDSSKLNSGSESLNQMILTNALAYKQDFGPIDTRLSYTFTHLPDGSSSPKTQSNYRSLRINTGFRILPRFKGRLILDDFFAKAYTSQKSVLSGQPIILETQNVRKNRQGSLHLQYNVLDWLSLTSQGALAQIENNDNRNPQPTITNRQQTRSFANLFTSINKPIGNSFHFNIFAGLQYERLRFVFETKTFSGNGELSYEYITKSIQVGAGLHVKDFLYSNFNYRQDYYSVYTEKNNTAPSTYSVNTAFVFSDAFGWKSSWFSFGKLRGSVGKTSVAFHQGFPDEWPGSGYIVDYNLHPSIKEMYEFGIDISLLKNRVTLNASYFSDQHNQAIGQIGIPNGSNGVNNLLTNVWNFNTKGWELILGGTPVKKKSFSMNTKLIWATYNQEVSSNVINENNPSFLRIPKPNWNGSLLNQFTYKNFFSSFLINFRKGGDFYTTTSPYPWQTIYTMQDGTLAKLRDLSIGYFSANGISKLKVREAQVSISGRNLWVMYSKAENDVENTQGTVPQKSVSLSLTLIF